jgi:hypothetical protein
MRRLGLAIGEIERARMSLHIHRGPLLRYVQSDIAACGCQRGPAWLWDYSCVDTFRI